MATKWSLQGLRAAWLHESSFRLEVYLLAVLGPLGLWLGQDGVERALLVGSCLLVLAMRTAQLGGRSGDRALRRRSTTNSPGRAKDMGSAAVFVLMMNVLLTWGLILGPR